MIAKYSPTIDKATEANRIINETVAEVEDTSLDDHQSEAWYADVKDPSVVARIRTPTRLDEELVAVLQSLVDLGYEYHSGGNYDGYILISTPVEV